MLQNKGGLALRAPCNSNAGCRHTRMGLWRCIESCSHFLCTHTLDCLTLPWYAQIALVSSRHDSTRLHVWLVKPMHFGCVELVKQDGSTHLTRRARLAWHVKLDTFNTTSMKGATRNLICCVICIKLWYVSYLLIYWSIHLFNLFLFNGTNMVCVCKSIKTT